MGDLRPLHEWVARWADQRDDVGAAELETRAIAHLEDLGELDGLPRGAIRQWLMTPAAAARLLNGLRQTSEHDTI